MDESEIDKALREQHEANNELRRQNGLAPLPLMPAAQVCSFCGKGKDEVRALFHGPAACICDACITKKQAIIAAERTDVN
jgi:hypothetical protein